MLQRVKVDRTPATSYTSQVLAAVEVDQGNHKADDKALSPPQVGGYKRRPGSVGFRGVLPFRRDPRAGLMNSVMFAAVVLQGIVVLGLSVGALVVSGSLAAWHLLLGGLVAVIPNALFALRLALHRGRRPESYPTVFFLGEFAKIGLTAGLLALLVRYEPDLQWLPVLIGLIAALKAPLLLMMWHPPASVAAGASRR